MHSPQINPVPVRQSWWRWAAFWVIAIGVAHLLDHSAWESLRDLRVNDKDWARLLRSFGYLPLWMFVGVAVLLHEPSDTRARWRAGAVVLVPAIAGLVAEIAKLLFRRLRPDADHFVYAFRNFSETTFSTRNLGLPSSHVMVAVGGAMVLAHLFPRTRWVWYVVAAGCALTRVMAVAHFLSDTVAAAAFAWVIATPLLAWIERKSERPA